MEDEEVELKDVIQTWANANGFFEFSARIAFVPEDVLRQLLFETIQSAEKILTDNGY